MRTPRPEAPVWTRWAKCSAALAAGALLLTACGTSSSDDGSAGEDPVDEAPTETAAPNTDRPEGPWTRVRWDVSNSGDPDASKGLATLNSWEVVPSCDEGPCDLTIKPAGVDGTYLPAGVPVLDDGNTSRGDEVTYTWDADEEMYIRVSEPELISCTAGGGELVPDAFENVSTTKLEFTPADGDQPASLQGTWEDDATGTPAGEAAGCTSIVVEGVMVASPTGVLNGEGEPDLARSYTTTDIVREITPEQHLATGDNGLLGPMIVAAADEGYTIAGLLETEAVLTAGDEGWSGSTGEVSTACNTDGGEVADAFTTTEEWSDLEAVAVTADDIPILAGQWSVTWTPTSAGEAAGCTAATNSGFVILVPTVSIGR